MAHGSYHIPRLFKYVPKKLGDLKILDIGSGLGEVGFYIHAMTNQPYYSLTGRPRITGIEIDEGSVNFCREWNKCYETIIQGDAENELNIMLQQRQTYDLGIMTEFLEHVEKAKALRILSMAERVCSDILIASPYGFTKNVVYPEHPSFNHVSAWYPKDFTKRGYRVTVEDAAALGSGIMARGYKFAKRVIGKPVDRRVIAVRMIRG